MLAAQISGENQRAHLGYASYHGRVNRDPSIKCGTTPGRFDLPTFLRLKINGHGWVMDSRLQIAGDFHHTDLCMPHHVR